MNCFGVSKLHLKSSEKFQNSVSIFNMSDQRYEFGPFVFDSKLKILLKNGSTVSIGQHGAALLECLLSAAGNAVSKSDLMDVAWGSRQVEESNLTVQIAALRKSLGRTAEGNEWIATVQRVGYQFVFPIQNNKNSIFSELTKRPSVSLEKPSIVVLPFSHLGSDPQFDYFADAMTEDIITALSRVGEFFVLSRTTSFAYKQRCVQAADLVKELGVRYLLEGSVRAVGQQLRVTAQLIDGESGGHVWAERFECELTDIFSVQDEIARSIAIAMQVKLSYGDLARLWEGQTRNLRAWEKMAQGRDLFLRFDSISVRHAQAALKEALQFDPNYTGAMVQLGLCYWWQARYDISVDKETSLQLCEDQARSALANDPTMGSAYMLLGGNAFLRDHHEEAVTLCEMAIELAPNDSWALAFLGLVCTYSGKVERAVEVINTAFRLSPHPPAWYYESLALALLWFGDYSGAEAAIEKELRTYPDDVDTLISTATIFGFQNRLDDAKRVVRHIRTRHPAYCLRDTMRTEHYKEKERLDKIIAVLREAGVPE